MFSFPFYGSGLKSKRQMLIKAPIAKWATYKVEIRKIMQYFLRLQVCNQLFLR